jgi:DNA-directed RNA polymerase subunit RPC12/RpoP
MEVTLSCGHKVKNITDFDNIICEICSKKEIEMKEKEKDEGTPKYPEYIEIMKEIEKRLKTINKKIKVKITKDENGQINYSFFEPTSWLRWLHGDKNGFEYNIKNVSKQPIQELKNTLSNIEERENIAKKFKERYSMSVLRFIMDEIFFQEHFNGNEVTGEGCTKNRQKIFGGGIGSIIAGIISLFIIVLL